MNVLAWCCTTLVLGAIVLVERLREAGLFVLSPVLFAGFVFSRSFETDAPRSRSAVG